LESKIEKITERENKIRQEEEDFQNYKENTMTDIETRIQTTHELIKTIMYLNHEDINSMEKASEKEILNNRQFSFDISKNILEFNQSSQPIQENSEEKGKIIIKEPLEVFELENDMQKDSKFWSGDKDSQRDNESQGEDQILKAYNPVEEAQDLKNKIEFTNVFMSPKFKSFEDNDSDEKLNIVSSEKILQKSPEECKEVMK